jgi:anti-sigma factor RsiW
MKSLMDTIVGSCAETRELLFAHVDDELRGLLRLRVRPRLAGCDACSAVARSWSQTVEHLHQVQDSFVPDPAFSGAPVVLERIQRREDE